MRGCVAFTGGSGRAWMTIFIWSTIVRSSRNNQPTGRINVSSRTQVQHAAPCPTGMNYQEVPHSSIIVLPGFHPVISLGHDSLNLYLTSTDFGPPEIALGHPEVQAFSELQSVGIWGHTCTALCSVPFPIPRLRGSSRRERRWPPRKILGRLLWEGQVLHASLPKSLNPLRRAR